MVLAQDGTPPGNSRSDLTRRRARLAGLVLVAALVTPAGVLTAGPVAAQEEEELVPLWSATLTVKTLVTRVGCSDGTNNKCTAGLSSNTFSFEGVPYTVWAINIGATNTDVVLIPTDTSVSPKLTDSMLEWTLEIDSTSFTFASNSVFNKASGVISWSPGGPSVSVGDMVTVRLLVPPGAGDAAFQAPHVVVPLAPDAPQLEAGPGALDVSWSPPAARAGGTLAACWVLGYSDDDGHSWITVPHHSTTPSATLEGLSAGQSYLVRVAALVSGRAGFWSPPSEATPAKAPDEPDGPGTTGEPDAADQPPAPGEPDTAGTAEELVPPKVPAAPGIPEDLAAEAGPGSLTVTWSAPEDDGAAPLLGYAVEYGTSGIVYHRWTHPGALTAATTVTIDGLTGNQRHYVQVGAVGCTGRSLWAPPVAATPTVTPTTTPAAPPAPLVTPGPGRFTVTWTAPDDDDGTPIRGYLLEYSTDSGATWTPQHHTAATTTITVIIGGLTGGHPHQVRVRATNSAGAGEPSTVVGAQPSAAAPDRPAVPTVTPGAGTLAVSWTAPHDNGAPITGYTIEYSTDQGHTWTTWPHTTTATTTVITDLTSGQRHQIRITATNTAGTSRPSPTHNTTPH